MTRTDHLNALIFDGRLPSSSVAVRRSWAARCALRCRRADVSLSLLRPEGGSILNILPVRCWAACREDGPGQVMVSAAGRRRARLL